MYLSSGYLGDVHLLGSPWILIPEYSAAKTFEKCNASDSCSLEIGV